MNHSESDVITISDLIKIILNYKKLCLISLICYFIIIMFGINHFNKEKYKYSISMVSPRIDQPALQTLWDSATQASLNSAIKNKIASQIYSQPGLAKALLLSNHSKGIHILTYKTTTKDKKVFSQIYTQLLNNVNQAIMPIITSETQHLKDKLARQKLLLNQVKQPDSYSDPFFIQQEKYTAILNTLDSIDPKLKTLNESSIVITPAHGIHFVIALAILLSILMSLITVFTVKGIVTIRDDIKQ